jgi:hypothetical protein
MKLTLRTICILLVLFSLQLNGQSTFLKCYKDSSNANNFGKVAFLAVDSFYIHAVFNSNFLIGGFCNGGNGSIYYLKINKTNGSIINSSIIADASFIARAASGYLYKHCIYLGGETANPYIGHSSFILKFDTQTNSIIWQKNFTSNASWNSLFAESVTTDIELLPNFKTIFFYGRGMYNYFNPSSGVASFKGQIDTAGNNFDITPFGFESGSYKTNPVFTNSNSGSKSFVLVNDSLTKKISLVTFSNNNIYYDWGAGIELNIQTTGYHFINKCGKKIISIIDKSNGTIAIVSDSLNNLLLSKNFNGLHIRSFTATRNYCLFTFINDVGSGRGNTLINIKTDSLLNTLSAKKMFLDTFQIKNFTCYSSVDNNYVYDVFSKTNSNAREIYLQKQSMSVLSCNEQFYTPILSPISISTISAVLSPSIIINATTITVNSFSKGLKDSLFCFVTAVKEQSLSENNLILFPNPANEILSIHISTSLNTTEKLKIKMYNSLGQMIKEEVLRQAQQPDGSCIAEINTKDLENGVYVLSLLDGSTSLTTGTPPSSATRSDRILVSKHFVIAR